MDKIEVFHEYARMIGPAAAAYCEKNQIPGFGVFEIYRSSAFVEFIGGPRQLQMDRLQINAIDKTGTIKTIRSNAVESIRSIEVMPGSLDYRPALFFC